MHVILVYILQDKMGKTEKKGKKITQLKLPKYVSPKKQKTKICTYVWDERNIRVPNKRTGLLFENENPT